MPTVTGLTAARMEEIENQSIVGGSISGDSLILTRFDGATINAGNVRGPQGIKGDTGPIPEAPDNTKAYVRKNNLWTPGPAEAPEDGDAYTRRDGAWEKSQWLHDLLASSSRDLAWSPSINPPHTVISSDAARLGPIVFAQAEFMITATSTASVGLDLPLNAPTYRAVGWSTSLGVFNTDKTLGTFRTNGGAGSSATLIHTDGSASTDFTNGDILAVSLVYIPTEEPI